MNKSKFLLLGFFLIWQNANSQLLYPGNKKDEYLPPYDPNVVIVSPDVEKWVKEQQSQGGEKRAVEMKTDVLGRVKSSTDKTKPEVRFVENKQKRLVLVSDMHIPESKIEPMSGGVEYNPKTKAYNYYLNDKKVSVKEYEILMAKSKEKNEQKKGKRNIFVPGVIRSDERSWTAWMTAEEISRLTNSYKELAIEDYREPIELLTPVSTILSRLQIPTGNRGSEINVCVIEVGCRDTSIPILNSNNYTSRCNGTARPHHSKVANVVQHAAPNAKVYGYGISEVYVNNPTKYPPYSDSCHIETRSYGLTQNPNSYVGEDMNLDNHIYDAPNYKWPINFVAAGNNGNDYVSSPSKAVNAITVGAVCPAAPCYQNTLPGNYTIYSSWKNPDTLFNEKPEVGMYTDIDMGSYNSIDGTSAATPLAAGLATNLLSNFTNRFFHGQPAVVKATLIVGEEIPIGNASTWDKDNWIVAQKIPTYNSINSFWYARWWNFGNDFLNNDLVFTENVPESGTYKIAIAWLSSGNYILSKKSLPQDIDLSVSQNGRTLYSRSANNPFEVVTFENVTPNTPLNIRIYRYSNSGNDHVLLGYAIRRVQ